MERAASGCTDWIASRFDTSFSFAVFCGLGNNGGDGLAIARLLSDKNYKVEVYIVRYSEKCSDDFLINEKRIKLNKNIIVHTILPSGWKTQIDSLKSISEHSKQIFIDALFGTGLNKSPEGLPAQIIQWINNSKIPVISIDIPSGLFCDSSSIEQHESVVKAKFTLTFEMPKLAFMFPENASKSGEWHIIQIGLDKKYIEQTETKNYFIDTSMAKSVLKKRLKFSHKGTFGHALLIAGSKSKMGAAVLAAEASLRSGAGLVTAHVPQCGIETMNSAVPESMTDPDDSEFLFAGIKEIEKYNAVGIGPGMGTERETQNALKLLIQNSVNPLVLDADALNILSENKTWLSFLPGNSILTPHVREFERLGGKSSHDFERHQMQIDFAVKHGVFVVLKGAHTCIVSPDGTSYFNSTGNPGMATAGSGDVLTGILTGLLAQHYSPKDACMLGVFLHGLAGDFAAEKFSQEAMIASDIISCMGDAFLFLEQP